MDAYADPLHFLPATSRDTSLKHDFTPVGTVNISLKITWDAPEDDVIAETRDEKESRLRNEKLIELGFKKRRKIPGHGERML